MARRGRGRGGASATKRKTSAKSDKEPPSKLQRGDSYNTTLRKIVTEEITKSLDKKVFKVDSIFLDTFDKNGKIHENYSAMLNQTNIGDNNNKFYVIQVIVAKKKYYCFTKWGRVGESGANKTDPCGDAEEAIKIFKKKFKDKTKNDWENREDFVPHPKKYTMLEIDEESEDVPDQCSALSPVNVPGSLKCQLDVRTALMIKLIFNIDMFTNQMAHMNLDVRKMPLGKLSKSQIAKGLEAILNIEKALTDKKGKVILSQLSSVFYTLIPHDFGRSVPTVLSSQVIIDQKKELMITLSDIELTLSLQKAMNQEDRIHPLDENYSKLGCKLDLIDKKSPEFKMLQKYATASKETRKGPLLDAWAVDRDGEGKRYGNHKKIQNRKLLWHGTNVAVVAAILNSGLRIMPHSGGRMGSGIYFASEHRKSSWYVGINYGMFEGENSVGFMFLVEVALGNEKTNLTGDSTLKAAPKGFDSVIARGMTEPDTKYDKIVKFEDKDVIVPLGKPKNSEFKTSSFGESEYLVYKESQARIRYLLKFSFA